MVLILKERYDRKLEELSMAQSKRQLAFEEDFHKNLNKINGTIEVTFLKRPN